MTKTEQAQENYLALVSGMDTVQEALDEVMRLLKRYRGMDTSWRSRNRRELMALRTVAQNRLDDLRETARNYEAAMVAKEWRP